MAALALAFVVSAGAVGLVGASRVGATPGAVAAMLALYGAFTLADLSARTVVDRSHEVALARLRGMTGTRLVTFAAGPLLAISLVGIAAGSIVGTELARRIADGWGASYSVGAREIVVAVAVLLGAWVTVAAVAAAVIRRPLVEALSTHPRRRDTSWITTFCELLVVAGACLAVYEAHRSEQGWVPSIAPALVALAAGQLVMWTLAWTPRLGRGLGLSLASRRLGRDPGPGAVVRVMVAAAVLLAVAATGGRAAAEWRDDAARVRAGGPIVLPFEAGGLRAYAAARRADPDGRWLMGAVAINDLHPADRRVFVDAARWDAVVGDFVADTSVAGAGGQMTALADQEGPTMMRGASLSVEVASVRGSGNVAVRYLSDAGYVQGAHVRVDHDGSVTGRLASCRVGCAVLSVAVRGDPFDVTQASAGGTRILGPTSYPGGGSRHVLILGPGDEPAIALTTPGLRSSAALDGIDGSSHRTDVVGTVSAVPFLGRAGSLLDLGKALRGAVGTVAVAEAVVVARADTPADVLARLRKLGGGKPTTYAAIAEGFEHTSQARADFLALLVAIGVGLVALTHLLAWLAGQMGRRRAEVGALRAAGIRPGTVRRAYVVEAALMAGVVLVTGAIVAAATTVPLLEPMPLVGGWAEAPSLRLQVRPVTLIMVVLGVALVTAVLCAIAFTRLGRTSRPAALRSAER
jgi:hypothetical protein